MRNNYFSNIVPYNSSYRLIDDVQSAVSSVPQFSEILIYKYLITIGCQCECIKEAFEAPAIQIQSILALIYFSRMRYTFCTISNNSRCIVIHEYYKYNYVVDIDIPAMTPNAEILSLDIFMSINTKTNIHIEYHLA